MDKLSNEEKKAFQIFLAEQLQNVANEILKEVMRDDASTQGICAKLQKIKLMPPLTWPGACNEQEKSNFLTLCCTKIWIGRNWAYLGEVYYMSHMTKLEKRDLHLFSMRNGVPMKADPLALGWKPPYWQDQELRNELETPLYRLRPKLVIPCHKKDIHYVGEFLTAWQKNILPRSITKRVVNNTVGDSAIPRMRSMMLVPPDWTAPNWKKDENWPAEIKSIKDHLKRRMD